MASQWGQKSVFSNIWNEFLILENEFKILENEFQIFEKEFKTLEILFLILQMIHFLILENTSDFIIFAIPTNF